VKAIKNTSDGASSAVAGSHFARMRRPGSIIDAAAAGGELSSISNEVTPGADIGAP